MAPEGDTSEAPDGAAGADPQPDSDRPDQPAQGLGAQIGEGEPNTFEPEEAAPESE